MGLLDKLAKILYFFDSDGEGYGECYNACLNNKLIDLAQEIEGISQHSWRMPYVSFSWSGEEYKEDYPINWKAINRIGDAFSSSKYSDWCYSNNEEEKQDYYDFNHYALTNNINTNILDGETEGRLCEVIRAYKKLNEAVIRYNL